MATKRAAIYLRVSTVEQGADQHVSLPVQEARCRAYVEQHGWTLITVESDRESGLRPSRAGYTRVLEMARDHVIDVVVVMAASRWGRDAAEVLVRAKELTDLKVELVSTSEDLSSFLMLGIQAVINQEESRRLSARVAPAKRFKVSQGYWMAHAPWGTRRVKGILEPNEDWHVVELLFRWCLDGVPIREMTRRVNGLLAPRTIDNSTTRKILVNDAYISVIHWNGETFPAVWPPLIPLDTFRAAGEALRLRYRQRTVIGPTVPYWAHGLAYCAHCGAKLAVKVERKPSGTIYPYFICKRTQVYGGQSCLPHVKILDLQEWVAGELQALRLSGVDVVRRIEEHESRELAALNAHRQALNNELSRLEARIARAEQGYLDGLWDAQRVTQIKTGLSDQIAALQRELSGLAPVRESDFSGLRDFFDDPKWLDERDQAPVEFRELLREVVSRIVVRGVGDYSLELVPALVVTR